MMKHPIGRRIADLWKGLLSQKEKAIFLKDLEREEAKVKAKLEQAFFEEVDQKDSGLLTDREYAEILQQVHCKMGVQDKKPRRLSTTWTIAAAMLLLIGVAAITFKVHYSTSEQLLSSVPKVRQDTISLFNTQSYDRSARLKDGSLVTLAPGAELRYTIAYGQSERTLHLRGRAKFEVAHDTSRPFTVWTDGYSTTALGTVFLIDANAENSIDISLLSGKIVVKGSPTHGRVLAEQYLVAGDKLSIDREAATFVLQSPKRSKPTMATEEIARDSEGSTPAPLRFTNEPLQSVFDVIAQRKQVQIVTANLDLHGLTFSGEFAAYESATMMIRVICQMNDLHCEETPTALIISQKIEANQTVPTGIKNQTTN
ncbi:FecR domain-containing protein [Sphingobacterium sp. lm-10]|uniref:FecR family protein n=1 Tax=Sphingobacterium sp. lm-10 TaxID=2944904 RepID=UPI002022147D|nr:FecR domain-containing protein [Sphingobacterium sp. lm-10]MCL7987264.1 FecR domain-containing protein [Sphingobacterium sp. lm-10]